MTVKLPQKAGFVATTAEWDQLVRIAENLAAQVVQAQASAVETARIVGAERDAARAEAAALRLEVARLREALDKAAQWIELWAHDVDQFSQRTLDGDVITKDDQLKELSQIIAALRGQPAPARGQE